MQEIIYFMIEQFRKQLIQENLSMNTVNSYIFTVEHFFSKFKEITKQNLLTYKGLLLEKYKGKTVNLRIQGIISTQNLLTKQSLK